MKDFIFHTLLSVLHVKEVYKKYSLSIINLTSIESKVTLFLFLNRRLRRHLQEDVVRDLCSSAAALQELETEFNQLQEDREILRRIIPSGNSKVSVLMN